MVHAKDLLLTPAGSSPFPLSGDAICAGKP